MVSRTRENLGGKNFRKRAGPLSAKSKKKKRKEKKRKVLDQVPYIPFRTLLSVSFVRWEEKEEMRWFPFFLFWRGHTEYNTEPETKKGH